MSKVIQTTQVVLMIEPEYFIYVTSFSSLNLSLIIWGSTVSPLPSLIEDKTVMKMMEQTSILDSAFHLFLFSIYLVFLLQSPLSPSFSSLPLTFPMLIFAVPRKSPTLIAAKVLPFSSSSSFEFLKFWNQDLCFRLIHTREYVYEFLKY